MLLLQVAALPSPESLVSAFFCSSMRLDRCAEQPFLLELCSWLMGLWVVHARKMREGEAEGQLPPCACGPCSTTVHRTAVRKESGISIQRGVQAYLTGGLHKELRGCRRFACV